jgi:CRISPR/Cas system-associated endonuclease Cas1
MDVLALVRTTKTEKILLLSSYGKYLGYQGMNFTIRNKNQTTESTIPFHEVKEIMLQSGNSVSTGALSAMMFWGIDALITTASGKPVGTGVVVKQEIRERERLNFNP